MNAGLAVGASRRCVDRAQLGVPDLPLRRPTNEPRIEAAGGDPRQATHRGHGIHGPVALHEPEDSGRIEAVS